MRKLLVGIVLSASLLFAPMLYAAAPLPAASIMAQQTVISELEKLEKSNGKYIRSAKQQALALILDAVKQHPELAASLTEYVIRQGLGLTATVTAVCTLAPEQAAAITSAAIKAAPPSQAALITAAAVKAAPKQAAAITTAAIGAVVKQAAAITSAAVSAAPKEAANVTKAALTAANSRETRRLIAIAASNAGVVDKVINNILKNITRQSDGSYEVFKKDTNNTTTSTITIGTVPNNRITMPVGVLNVGSTTTTNLVSGGGSGCRKQNLIASCH